MRNLLCLCHELFNNVSRMFAKGFWARDAAKLMMARSMEEAKGQQPELNSVLDFAALWLRLVVRGGLAHAE